MECPHCRSSNPEEARFCQRCGQTLGEAGSALGRRSHYAAHPNEPVASFALVSTIMPHTSRHRAHHYRVVLAIGMAIPLITVALGLLPIAVVAAAFVLPIVYIIYIYDIDLWEEEPVLVMLSAFVLSALLAVGFTVVWREVAFKSLLAAPLHLVASTPRLADAAVLCLLVPAGSEVLKQVGPLFLASRPRFDELMDGLTFGIVSGVAYSAFETLVLQRDVILDAPLRTGAGGVGSWLMIVLTLGVLKPVVYGTATGIACAEFSGLGEGHDGFTRGYLFAFLEAVAANVLLQLGLYLFGLVSGPGGALLGLIWGALLAAVLVIQMRSVLHAALLEQALETDALASMLEATKARVRHCSHCEMPLLESSLFCVACGAAVSASPKAVPVSPTPSAPAASPARETGEPVGETVIIDRPRRHHKIGRPLHIGIIVLVVLAVLGAGAVGLAKATQNGGQDAESVQPDLPAGAGPASSPSAVGQGVTVAPARGWTVANHSDGFSLLTGRGATFAVQATAGDPKASAEGIVAAYAQGVLSGFVVDLSITQPDTEDRPKPDVASAGSLTYRGTLASAQESVAVEGIVYGFVRQDGLAVVVSTLARRHRTDSVRGDFGRMLSSVLTSL